MKKTACLFLSFLLAFGLVGFAGCDAGQNASVPDKSKEEPSDSIEQGTSPSEIEQEAEKRPSPLAVLEKIDMAQAFGDTAEEGWSYGLKLSGGYDSSYSLRWYSELSEAERYYVLLGGGIVVEDELGVRADAESPLGFDFFGGGNIAVSTRYTGPTSDSEPVEGSYEAGFRHDGDLIWYAGESGEESMTVEELSAYAEDLKRGVNERILAAAATIPEDIRKGLSLRFAVEDLIDLGFTAEIDDSDGLKIRLTANKGFYTDFLNDMAEELLPGVLLSFLPRIDFRYDETVFDIVLSFGQDGLFREYSVENSVALGLSLELRGLFVCESGYTFKGTGSVTAVSAPQS